MCIRDRIKAVCAAFFSATGTTKKIVWEIAKEIAVELKISLREFDFTLPQARRNPPVFSENEIVVFGTPVYLSLIHISGQVVQHGCFAAVWVSCECKFH